MSPMIPGMPSHDQLASQLQKEADSRGLYFDVWCTALYEGDQEEYQAIATHGDHFKIYIEEGATDYWGTLSGYPTPDAAAHALLRLLESPPNRPAQNKGQRLRCPREPWSGSPRVRPDKRTYPRSSDPRKSKG